MNNVILHLIGFAGTGKLTIAHAILARAPFLLVDNHFINNVVFRLIDTDGKSPLPPRVWENVRKVRAIVFDTLRELAQPARNFVLTNQLVEGAAEDEKVFQEVRALARARGAAFLPVRLLIAPEELARRVVSPQRQALLKSRDPHEAWRMAGEHQVYIPKDVDYFELEVTTLAPADAAERILAEVRQRFASHHRVEWDVP
jgi:AAA domain